MANKDIVKDNNDQKSENVPATTPKTEETLSEEEFDRILLGLRKPFEEYVKASKAFINATTCKIQSKASGDPYKKKLSTMNLNKARDSLYQARSSFIKACDDAVIETVNKRE